MRKALTFAAFGLLPLLAAAQIHNREKDFVPFHFGITLGYGQTNFKIVHSEAFIRHDSILRVESPRRPGLNIGIVSNLRLGNYLDLRFIPALAFAEKKIDYTLTGDSLVAMNIESIYLDFPLSLKFKSERVRNFRMYLLGGGKYSKDMASNSEARNAQDILKIKPDDFSVELGFGLEFYAPMFKFSPELKFSYGLFDILVHDDGFMYSEVLRSLVTRGFLISFHFEG